MLLLIRKLDILRYILQESLIILSQFALCKKLIINETTNIADKPKEKDSVKISMPQG